MYEIHSIYPGAKAQPGQNELKTLVEQCAADHKDRKMDPLITRSMDRKIVKKLKAGVLSSCPSSIKIAPKHRRPIYFHIDDPVIIQRRQRQAELARQSSATDHI